MLSRRLPMLWNSTLKMTTLFWRCLTLFISMLKYTTLIRRCSTLQFRTLKYTTLFQHWFDVVPRRDILSTKRQRWNNVEMFAGFLKTFLYLCFHNLLLVIFIYLKETIFLPILIFARLISVHNLHWGTPPQKHHPRLSCQAIHLKSANCQAAIFRKSSLYIGFSWIPLSPP